MSALVEVCAAIRPQADGSMQPLVVVVAPQPHFVLTLDQSAALRARLLLAEDTVRATAAAAEATGVSLAHPVGNA
jgi:hypothetical protein